MDLSRKYADVPKAERRAFLKKKLRELNLVHAVDRITDKQSALSDLARATLRKMRRFFDCRLAGLLMYDHENRTPVGYYLLGIPRHDPDARGKALAIRQFLLDQCSCSAPLGIDPIFPEASPDDLLLGAWRRFNLSEGMVGILLVAQGNRPFAEEDLHYLGAIASQIDNGLLHGRFMEKFRRTRSYIRKKGRQLDFMYEISLSIGRDEDFVSLTKRILESSMQLVEVNRCSLMLYDVVKDELRTELVVGAPFIKTGFMLRKGEGVAGKALQLGKSLLAEKGSRDQRFVTGGNIVEAPDFTTNLACVPLICDETPLGVLNFTSTDQRYSVTQSELETLEVVAHLILLAWQRQRLYKMATKDELTGLYLFRHLRKLMDQELEIAAGSGKPLSLILFDIDHFKKINDTHGHMAGNQVLQAVAGLLKGACRHDVDHAARFGGEEFVLILPGLNAEQARSLAEDIREKVGDLSVKYESQQLKLTISGGIASADQGGTADEILDRADRALYLAKESGRNRIVLSGATDPNFKPV